MFSRPSRPLIIILLSFLSIALHAQESDSTSCRPEFSLDYTTELLTDMKRAKWNHLLGLSCRLPLSERLAFDAGSISVLSTSKDFFTDDLQGLSNIEEANLPFALTVACLEWQVADGHTLYAGIRRMDEDYFCSDGLSFFTNSSCGAFPTVSLNHDIAVFPNAAMGIHYAYDSESLTLNLSLYNGRGNNGFAGRSNVFRLCPQSDGVFALGQMEYRHRGSSYFLGTSMHYGESFSADGRRLSPVAWTYAEQSLGSRLMLLAAVSHAFGSDAMCRNFAGLGAEYGLGCAKIGVFTDYVRVDGIDEYATEFSCSVPLCRSLSLQPTMHLISTDGTTKCIAMMRMCLSL